MQEETWVHDLKRRVKPKTKCAVCGKLRVCMKCPHCGKLVCDRCFIVLSVRRTCCGKEEEQYTKALKDELSAIHVHRLIARLKKQNQQSLSLKSSTA